MSNTDLDDIDWVNERDSDNSGASGHTHLCQETWGIGRSCSHHARLHLMLLGLHGDGLRGVMKQISTGELIMS